MGKALFILEIGSQRQVRVIFKGSHLKSTVRHQSLRNLVIILYVLTKDILFSSLLTHLLTEEMLI